MTHVMLTEHYDSAWHRINFNYIRSWPDSCLREKKSMWGYRSVREPVKFRKLCAVFQYCPQRRCYT